VGEPLTCSLSDLDIIRQQNHVFENIVGSSGGIVLVGDGLKTYQFNDSRVTSDAFEFYGVPALLGRGIEPEDGKAGAPLIFVMSYKTWQDDFNGDLSALGKSYVVDGESRSLVGVMPPRFHAYGPGMQIWTPIAWNSGTSGSGQELRLNLLGRLRHGTTLEAASSNFEVIAKRLAAIHPNDFPKHFTARVESAEDFLMGPKGGGPTFHSDVKHLMYDLLIAVMILLLIACSNVANLLLARGAVREKEIAVRSALGATRGRLVRQLLAESCLLAISACILGCVFAWIGLKFVATVLPQTGGSGSVFATGRSCCGPGCSCSSLRYSCYAPDDVDLRLGPGTSRGARGCATPLGGQQRRKRWFRPWNVSRGVDNRRSGAFYCSIGWHGPDDSHAFSSHAR
jgi:putative ABC transport system permease protein